MLIVVYAAYILKLLSIHNVCFISRVILASVVLVKEYTHVLVNDVEN